MEEEIRKEFMEMIKLLEEGKLQEFKQKATECPPVDIAEGLEEIEDEGRVLRVFRMLPKDISSDVFSYMTSEQQQLIAESATNAELKALVDDMFMDDTVDFLEEMPANVVKKVLQNADEGTRKTINQFLNYPENSAGSLMTIEYVDLHDYFTVRKAMDYIRRTGIDKETVYTCYVIDDQRRLVGQVSLRKLIIAPESACIRDIMGSKVLSARRSFIRCIKTAVFSSTSFWVYVPFNKASASKMLCVNASKLSSVYPSREMDFAAFNASFNADVSTFIS